MRYLRGFGEIRKDPGLLGKLVVGTLLVLSGLFIPIVGSATLRGWYALAMREELAGRGTPLPPLSLDFGYLGKLLGPGFKSMIVGFVWGLPMLILVSTLGGCMYAALMTVVGVVGSSLEDGGGAGSTAGMVLFLVFLVVSSILFVVLGLLASLPTTMAIVRAEVSGDVGKGLEVGAVLRGTRLVAKEIALGNLLNLLAGALLGFVGFLLLCLGLYPAFVAASAARAYFHADLYRLAVERGMPPLEIAPPEAPPAGA